VQASADAPTQALTVRAIVKKLKEHGLDQSILRSFVGGDSRVNPSPLEDVLKTILERATKFDVEGQASDSRRCGGAARRRSWKKLRQTLLTGSHFL
jgi:hypothetical protein